MSILKSPLPNTEEKTSKQRLAQQHAKCRGGKKASFVNSSLRDELGQKAPKQQLRN